LIFCLTTQQDTVVTAVGASQAHINNILKNLKKNILNCAGNILYRKLNNEIGLAPSYVKVKEPNISPSAMSTNTNYEMKNESCNIFISQKNKNEVRFV